MHIENRWRPGTENYTPQCVSTTEMGGIPADYNPIQCVAPPVGGADVGGISAAEYPVPMR